MTDLVTIFATAIAAAAGLAALLWRFRRQGAAEERDRIEQKDLEVERATRRRMDDATNDLDDDPAHLRDWLHQRGRE